MIANIKLLSSTAKIPSYGSEKAACCDLYADLKDVNAVVTIKPGSTVKIGTGVSIQPPSGYFGIGFARSGLAVKHGLRPANCCMIMDEDYTGEYIVALHNDSDNTQYVSHGMRIAQIMFIPYEQVSFNVVEELDATARGDGGFGHTGE